MIPDNSLSSEPVPSPIIGGKANPHQENGGVGLGDASEGLLYQIWTGSQVGDNIYVEAPNTAATLVYSGANISEFSFTFDQNMRITIAFVQAGVAKIYWYDSTIEDYATTAFESGARCPKVLLDDKRASQTSVSDVLLVYINGDKLYFRQQRDRYGTRYELCSGVTDYTLTKIGMGNNYRIQFIFNEACVTFDSNDPYEVSEL